MPALLLMLFVTENCGVGESFGIGYASEEKYL